MNQQFHQWVNDYRDHVWTLARNLLSDRAEAEDVTQEAYLKLWHHREDFAQRPVRPWLLRVTRNLCIDRLRVRKTTVELSEADAETTGPQREVSAAREVDDLRAAIAAMDEPFRSLILLRDMQQHRYDEVARILELSESQVKVYLHRARTRLRDLLVTRRGIDEA